MAFEMLPKYWINKLTKLIYTKLNSLDTQIHGKPVLEVYFLHFACNLSIHPHVIKGNYITMMCADKLFESLLS